MNRLIVFLMLLFVTTACEERPISTLKLAHGLDSSHPVHLSMVRMGELLETYADGSMRLEIYPSEQLGSERQSLELLQIGSLDITKVSAAVLENFAPDMQVFSLPYLFRDDAHANEVFHGSIGKSLLVGMDEYLIRGLTYFDAGNRSFYTRQRLVNSPDDLSGLKIRVQESPTAMQMVRELGASPTPIAWGELYTALQQGVIDGAENNAPSFHLSRHYEVCKYYILNEHTAVPDVLVIGTLSWNRLSSEQKKWLQMAADSAAAYQQTLWLAAEAKALDEVAAAGVQIIRPDKSAFAQKTASLLENLPPHLKALVQKIQAYETHD
ncbi:MAG TPA: TRAP transporter substrate-binding protein [Saprospiraceae bacterium]|nr:TRAP transporter substrate-binding protein [Saprospiraceae bacterium]HMQ81431.1 TRAP transporter substrate-binding protein [Saprospiraceae bacterium]